MCSNGQPKKITSQFCLAMLLIAMSACVPVILPGQAWKQVPECGTFPPLVREAIAKNDATIPYSKTRGTITPEMRNKPLLENGKHPDLVMIGTELLHSKRFGWTIKIPYGVQVTLFENKELILISTAHTFDDNFSIFTKFQTICYLIEKENGKVLKHLKTDGCEYFEDGVLYLLYWPDGYPSKPGPISVQCFSIK